MTLALRSAWIATFLFSFQTFASIPHKPFQIEDPNPNVRVRLKDFREDKIELIGSHVILNNQTLNQNSAEISRSQDEWLVDVGTETLKFPGRKLLITAETLFINKTFVPSSIVLNANDDSIELIANLPLETYLEGVVSAEIPRSWPHEAQKAQAITARTFTLNKLKERRYLSFDVEAGVMDQAFKYRKFESLNSSQKAVRETRGKYIANSVGIIEPVFYHASCGGATDGADKIFGQPVSKQARNNSVRDSCALNVKTLWKAEVSETELEQKLKKALHWSQSNEILELTAEQITIGGRIAKLAINTSQGKFVVPGETLRSILGYGRIKSTKFSVEKKDQRFVFTGRGLGHGVGLCQWGARDLALKGKTAKEILSFYFPYLHVESKSRLQAERKTVTI